jgi:hypothetical protein
LGVCSVGGVWLVKCLHVRLEASLDELEGGLFLGHGFEEFEAVVRGHAFGDECGDFSLA